MTTPTLPPPLIPAPDRPSSPTAGTAPHTLSNPHADAITRLELAARRLQERARWLEPMLQQRHLDLAAHFRQQARCLGASLPVLPAMPGWPGPWAGSESAAVLRPCPTRTITPGATPHGRADPWSSAPPLNQAARFQRPPARPALRPVSAPAASPPAASPHPTPTPDSISPDPGPRGLDDLAGAPALKALLRERFIHPLRHPEQAALYRQQVHGGLLLYGPPGTGKTLAVRALAAELRLPVFNISPADVLSKWLGDSEKQLAQLFGAARQHPAALVFIDEIDALAGQRDGAGASEAGGPMQRLLTQLLVELDGYRPRAGQLLFIGATNRPWAIDEALLRPGRFDALAYVGLPGATAREQLLRRHLHGVPAEPGLPWAEAAATLAGCTPVEVKACAQQAARLAFEAALRSGQALPLRPAHLRTAAAQASRGTTPQMLARFARFAEQRGLPPTDDADHADIPDHRSTPSATPPSDDTARTHPAGATDSAPPGSTRMDAPPLDPLRAVVARDLRLELDALPFLCYALQHAGMAPVQNLALHNRGAEPSQNLLVEVALVPADYGEPWQINLAELAPQAEWQSGPIRLPLRLDRLRAIAEKEGAHLRITVRDKDEVLLARTLELPVLAYNEWVYLPRFLQLCAAFVQPNSPSLHPVVQAAAAHLQQATGSSSLPGYQAGSAPHVAQMLRALHRALAEDCSLAYINPPPSFELSGQKVRLVADTLAQGRGTCLDLAILQAALWEHVGLHPCLVLLPGHAMLACWMEEVESRHAVVAFGKPQAGPKGQATPRVSAHQQQVLQALQTGQLRLFNSVEVAMQQSLEEAEQRGRELFEHHLAAGEELQLIDVVACRGEVTPLP